MYLFTFRFTFVGKCMDIRFVGLNVGLHSFDEN